GPARVHLVAVRPEARARAEEVRDGAHLPGRAVVGRRGDVRVTSRRRPAAGVDEQWPSPPPTPVVSGGGLADSPIAEPLARIERAAGALSTARVARMDDVLPWFREIPADQRAWVTLVARAGVRSLVEWLRRQSLDPEAGSQE